MNTARRSLTLASALVAALALGACGKSNEPASPVAPTPPPSATAMTPPMTSPASAKAEMPTDTVAGLFVSSVEIGASINAQNEVRASGTSFAPKDNIYAAVKTQGEGHATLGAKWTFNGSQIVHEDSKRLDTTGAQTTTAFMISKPDGFPVGDYKVEVSLDGKPVASKDFSVKK